MLCDLSVCINCGGTEYIIYGDHPEPGYRTNFTVHERFVFANMCSYPMQIRTVHAL